MMTARRTTNTPRDIPAPDKPLDVQAFKQMSQKERLIAVTTHNIEKYGDVEPPPEVVYASVEKHCKRCGKTKPVIPDFGLSMGQDGVRRPNGWCTKCRNESRNEKKPRIHKARTPRFPTEFLHTMDKHQRARYMQLYNEVAEELGKEVVADPLGAISATPTSTKKS